MVSRSDPPIARRFTARPPGTDLGPWAASGGAPSTTPVASMSPREITRDSGRLRPASWTVTRMAQWGHRAPRHIQSANELLPRDRALWNPVEETSGRRLLADRALHDHGRRGQSHPRSFSTSLARADGSSRWRRRSTAHTSWYPEYEKTHRRPLSLAHFLPVRSPAFRSSRYLIESRSARCGIASATVSSDIDCCRIQRNVPRHASRRFLPQRNRALEQRWLPALVDRTTGSSSISR